MLEDRCCQRETAIKAVIDLSAGEGPGGPARDSGGMRQS